YLRLSALLCSQIGFASGFEFSDFSATKGLSLQKAAHRSKKVLRLTDALQSLAGAAWFEERQAVRAGFETTFTFRLTDQDPAMGGADGLAFVVQNENKHAIGGFGASGGFMRSDEGAQGGMERPIVRAVAVFFDTYANRWDESDNHVAICTNGDKPSMIWPPRC